MSFIMHSNYNITISIIKSFLIIAIRIIENILPLEQCIRYDLGLNKISILIKIGVDK